MCTRASEGLLFTYRDSMSLSVKLSVIIDKHNTNESIYIWGDS